MVNRIFLISFFRRLSGNQKSLVSFRCNICGRKCAVPKEIITREQRSCPYCNSTVRFRSVIHHLANGIFGKSIPIPDFPVKKEISGIGMSEWRGYARPLAKKFNFINTFFHKKPYMDITRINPDMEQKFDFVLSSDVFEHINPPIIVAFENVFKLLRPGGIFVLTVPYLDNPGTKTIEHYPELHRFDVFRRNGNFCVSNYTKDGKYQEFSEPVFHGGKGQTLEMRVFSKEDLIEILVNVGFIEIIIHQEEFPDFGIFCQETRSFPITARKPQ